MGLISLVGIPGACAKERHASPLDIADSRLGFRVFLGFQTILYHRVDALDIRTAALLFPSTLRPRHLRYQTLESQLIQYYTILQLLGLYMTYIKIPQVSTSTNNVGCS